MSDTKLKNAEQQEGFLIAIEMIRDRDDRYGIGSMCSQWTADEIADDLVERIGDIESVQISESGFKPGCM